MRQRKKGFLKLVELAMGYGEIRRGEVVKKKDARFWLS